MTPRGVALFVALALSACSGGRDKLIADLQSPRPEERALAVKKLAEQKHSEDLVLFTQAARDPVAIVRAEAIDALGASEDSRVVDLLGELLSDDDEAVQARAAMALAHVGNDKARGYLMLQYGRRGRATRQAIVQALTATNVPGAMASVVAAEAKGIWERNLETLQKGTAPERVGAAEELGKSGRPEAVNRLVPLLKDGQVMLAAAAVRGLGNAGDRRAVAPISELLTESYPQLREAACEALMELKDSAALPRLLEVALERSSVSALAVTAIIAQPQTAETDKALCDIALAGRPQKRRWRVTRCAVARAARSSRFSTSCATARHRSTRCRRSRPWARARTRRSRRSPRWCAGRMRRRGGSRSLRSRSWEIARRRPRFRRPTTPR